MTVKIGYPEVWGNLQPSLQHTAYADSIISNVFESLVRHDYRGMIIPKAAKSWKVSDDHRVFEFEIDTSKRFSDGTRLEARHFKDAWLDSLELTPKSANNSLMDVLYRIEGFENFKQSKDIPGIKVLGKDSLQITFSESFRMALDHLAGGRMAVYMQKQGDFLGTGAYKIAANGENHVVLKRNPYAVVHVPIETVDLSVVKAADAVEMIHRGDLDAYFFYGAENCSLEGNAGCLEGAELAHRVLTLNGMPGRVLQNPEYRRTLQALVTRFVREEQGKGRWKNGFRFDPQTFLPFQPGRLSEIEVDELLGGMSLEGLKKATAKKPLVVIRHEKFKAIF